MIIDSLVRQLRRRRDAGARGRRHAAPKDERIQLMATDAQSTVRTARRVHAEVGAARIAVGGRGGLHHRRHQGTAGGEGRRHRHAREEAADNAAPRPSRCRASRKSSRRCSPASTRSRRTSTTRCATRSKSSSSTTRRCTTSRKCRQALGFGFRCGFLGLLHMEIVQERLEREFDQDLITTAPTRRLRGRCSATATVILVENPSKMPDPAEDRGDPRADRHGAPVHAAGVRRPGDDAGQPEARRADQHGLPRPPGACSPTRCRWPRSCSTSSTS